MRASGQTFLISNFTDVVPKVMAECKPDVLVLQRDSITLTNLPADTPKEYAMQEMKVTSQNMMTVATTALATSPTLQQVILMQAIPRYDGKEELNDYGNEMLPLAKEESSSVHKHRVVIGSHNLDCEGGLRTSRFGDGRKGSVDMIHMRGSSCTAANTRSVASIFAGAGLTTPEEAAKVARPGLKEQEEEQAGAGRSRNNNGGRGEGFQVQKKKGRKGKGRQQQHWQQQQWQQPSPFELATFNRFASFQGNW